MDNCVSAFAASTSSMCAGFCLSRIRWQDEIANTEVLRRFEISGIEAVIIKAQLRYVGHVHRMPHSWIPKALFCSECNQAGAPRQSTAALQRQPESQHAIAVIDPRTWENLASNRPKWREACIAIVCSIFSIANAIIII